jgi:hypothetical protein
MESSFVVVQENGRFVEEIHDCASKTALVVVQPIVGRGHPGCQPGPAKRHCRLFKVKSKNGFFRSPKGLGKLRPRIGQLP